MKRYLLILVLVLACLLPGCGFWMDGEYLSVTPHVEKNYHEEKQVVEVTTSSQLRSALLSFVENGKESGTIIASQLSRATLHLNMESAVRYVSQETPIGAYAVKDIAFEIGTTSGTQAIGVTITYRHDRSDILRIGQAVQMSEAEGVIFEAMHDCAPSVVFRTSDYKELDYEAIIAEYVEKNPDVVMQQPEICVAVYPEFGEDRIVSLTFTYQNSRENLLQMQELVAPVFTSAQLYVQGVAQVREKYAQIHAFLMERFDYSVQPSATPTYSLLFEGVGDGEIFARVYAAMCRRAGIECHVVTGTKNAQPWVWNLIYFRGSYYHLDLLDGAEFQPHTKDQMEGYVWEDAAYPD